MIGVVKDGQIERGKGESIGEATNSNNGSIIAIVKENGREYKVRLGGENKIPNRNLNDREADVLLDIADRIMNQGQQPSKEYLANGFKNLTVSNILSLLIYRESENFVFAAPDKNGDFKRDKDDVINQTWKVLTITDGNTQHVFTKKDLTDSKRRQDFKKIVKKTLVRQVHAPALGKDLFSLDILAGKAGSVEKAEILFFGDLYKEGESPYETSFLKTNESGDKAVITTDIKVDARGSINKHKFIYLSNKVSNIPPLRTGRKSEKGPLTAVQQQKIQTLENASAQMKLVDDGNGISYYIKLDANGEPLKNDKGELITYQRVSNYIAGREKTAEEKKAMNENNLVQSSLNIGNGIDKLTRDFFGKGKESLDIKDYYITVQEGKKKVKKYLFEDQKAFDNFIIDFRKTKYSIYR